MKELFFIHHRSDRERRSIFEWTLIDKVFYVHCTKNVRTTSCRQSVLCSRMNRYCVSQDTEEWFCIHYRSHIETIICRGDIDWWSAHFITNEGMTCLRQWVLIDFMSRRTRKNVFAFTILLKDHLSRGHWSVVFYVNYITNVRC